MNGLFYAAAGFLSGAAASMGLGGGFILLLFLGFFSSLSRLESQLINLLFFLPISLFSILLHRKNHLIEGALLPKIILFGLIGAMLGIALSAVLPEQLLGKLFGALVAVVGIRELFHSSSQ